jgi:hypothetical protein
VSLQGGKGFNLAECDTDAACLYSTGLSGYCVYIGTQDFATGLLREVNNTCEEWSKTCQKKTVLVTAVKVSFVPVTGVGGTSLSVAARSHVEFH